MQRTTFKEAFIPDLMDGVYLCKTPPYEAGKELWQQVFCFYMKKSSWFAYKYSILLRDDGEIIRIGWFSNHPRVNESGI